MGSASNNLVIIKGTKEDLLEFKKTACKNDSEAFCFQQLLPYPDYFEGSEKEIEQQKSAYSHLFYGNKWGAGYGVLTRYAKNIVIYIFNSRTTIANLTYISKKYSNLDFIHIGLTTNENPLKWSYFKYKKGTQICKYRLTNNQFDFQISSYLYNYEYMAELYIKFESLIQHKKHVFNKLKNDGLYDEDLHSVINFYDLFHKPTYLRNNKDLFDKILLDVKNLENKDLNWAKNKIGYTFKTNNLYDKLAFIKNNFTNDEQNKYLEEIEKSLEQVKDNSQTLIYASHYVFTHFDKYNLFVKLMKLALSKLTNELDVFINSFDDNKNLLKDYPGIIPYYNIDKDELEQMDTFFELYGWDILKKEQEEYYSKLEKVQNIESEFDNFFYKNIKEVEEDKTLNQEQKNTKIKQYVSEAIDYINLCENNYQKLNEIFYDSNNSFSFAFEKNTNIDYCELRKIANQYALLDSFPEIKEQENEDDDLPF